MFGSQYPFVLFIIRPGDCVLEMNKTVPSERDLGRWTNSLVIDEREVSRALFFFLLATLDRWYTAGCQGRV